MRKEEVYNAIAEVCGKEQKALLDKQNVIGVGTGHKIKDDKDTGEPCIMVLVSQKLDKDELRTEDMVSKTVKGLKTDVLETGEIFAGEAFAANDTEVSVKEEIGIETLKQRIRPAMGG